GRGPPPRGGRDAAGRGGRRGAPGSLSPPDGGRTRASQYDGGRPRAPRGAGNAQIRGKRAPAATARVDDVRRASYHSSPCQTAPTDRGAPAGHLGLGLPAHWAWHGHACPRRARISGSPRSPAPRPPSPPLEFARRLRDLSKSNAARVRRSFSRL